MNYPPQQQPSGEQYYSPQQSYPPTPAPGEYYQPQQPAPTYYPPQQGPYASPQAYGQPAQNPYPPQGQYVPPPPAGTMPYGQPYQQQPAYGAPMQQLFGVVKNVRAGRAMVYGIISVVLGMLTLVTLAGFAGVITGIFAVIYGFTALNASRTLPNNMGRGKALTGIILGFAAIGLVIISFIIRSATSGA